ncbi:alpha-dioxygenase PIOX [Oryza glaberrima]|uniref:alpha-dioxygenase PIOX n=1 Tax=Oryza glaberrima TaxID=4538 RepID=UPI00224BEBB3|nr:alpha-dioxygenase PIOX [Oryza glaberrima]
MGSGLFKPRVHPDLRDVFSKMSFFDKIGFLFIHAFDKRNLWHKVPVPIGLLYLNTRRTLLEKYNLLAVGRSSHGALFDPKEFLYRTEDGKYNDPHNAEAGSQNTFFGRNMEPVDQKDELTSPDPFVVATKLLARREYKDTGKQFNILAAAWIQFMVHDWMDHMEDTGQIEITAPKEVANECPLKSFKFHPTKELPTNSDGIKIGHYNVRTAWWDGSAVYGNNEERAEKLRTYVDGKLVIGDDGLLLHKENGVALSGDIRNSWAGVSILQALFVKEHNAVCDAIKEEHPNLSDEELYRYAKLVTSAVIAKVHTIDWTVELLKTKTMRAAMRANWYGLLGKKIKDTFGHIGGPILGGLVGLKKPNNHGVPYSLTEEFTSVYRMHSLIPSTLKLRDPTGQPDANNSPPYLEDIDIGEMIGLKGEEQLSKIGFEKQALSMGYQACGALELWNYPSFFRNLIPQNLDGTNRSDRIDLAALEVYRDRERSVPRYNEFRRRLFLIPIKSWEDLTSDKDAIETIRAIYGDDVEKLDLLVGLMAEKKIKGFAISETAFNIFILMASRRLEADRFFTSNFNEETYTKKGMQWVKTTEGLRDVINRHYPEITAKWMKSSSAFSVWDADY